jgi:hypothetical protein
MRTAFGFVEFDIALASRTEPSPAVRRLITGDAVDDGGGVRDARLLGHVVRIGWKADTRYVTVVALL